MLPWYPVEKYESEAPVVSELMILEITSILVALGVMDMSQITQKNF